MKICEQFKIFSKEKIVSENWFLLGNEYVLK